MLGGENTLGRAKTGLGQCLKSNCHSFLRSINCESSHKFNYTINELESIAKRMLAIGFAFNVTVEHFMRQNEEPLVAKSSWWMLVKSTPPPPPLAIVTRNKWKNKHYSRSKSALKQRHQFRRRGKRKWEIHQLLSDNVPARSPAPATTGTYNSQFNLLSMSRVRSFNVFICDGGNGGNGGRQAAKQAVSLAPQWYTKFHISSSVCLWCRARAHFPLRISDTTWAETNLFAFDYIFIHFLFTFPFSAAFLFFGRRSVWAKYFGVGVAACHNSTVILRILTYSIFHSDIRPMALNFLYDRYCVRLSIFSRSILVLLFIDIVLSKSFFLFFIAAVASSAFLLYMDGSAFLPNPAISRPCRRYGCGRSKWGHQRKWNELTNTHHCSMLLSVVFFRRNFHVR